MDLFAFGTLRYIDRMQDVTGRENWVFENATLVGYSRIFPYNVGETGVPYLVPDAEGETPGVLYRDVDEESLRRLDIYEGVPFHYYRTNLLVTTSRRSAPAAVYLTGPGRMEMFRRGVIVRKDAMTSALFGRDWTELLDLLEGEQLVGIIDAATLLGPEAAVEDILEEAGWRIIDLD